VRVFATIDGWLGLPIPGAGFIATVLLITLFGFLASSFLTRRMLSMVEGMLERLPFVRLLYSSTRDLLNRMHLLYLGYGWGSHWNLSAAAAGGQARVGWRRFYFDGLVTLPGLTSATPIGKAAGGPADFFPVGARIGMEGAIDALIRDAPGVGFGYSLELGALPGRSGVEGYLLVGLGLALDGRVRARPIR
jgi:hypothetical protein